MREFFKAEILLEKNDFLLELIAFEDFTASIN